MTDEYKEMVCRVRFIDGVYAQTYLSDVEIVRCKDCKYYEIQQLKKDGTDDRRYKPSYCVNLAFNASPDWFCADGERREDEAD